RALRLAGTSRGGPMNSGVTSHYQILIAVPIWIINAAYPLRADFASQQKQPDSKIERVINGLHGSDWAARGPAFDDILTLAVPGGLNGQTSEIKHALADLLRRFPAQGDNLKLALINALELENTASKTKMEEEQADYYGDLIAAVAGLADVC